MDKFQISSKNGGMWKKLKYEAWSQVLALIDQRAHGGQKSLFTVDNWERENTITDGGSTAVFSKVISGWTDGLDSILLRKP